MNNYDAKLCEIKIKYKCLNILKYFSIHSYQPELVFLKKTFDVLRRKYDRYDIFIHKLTEIIESTHANSSKINNLIELIESHNYYDLYNDIINTLEC